MHQTFQRFDEPIARRHRRWLDQRFRRSAGRELARTRTIDFARCFLRLSNLPNYALDRLSRYEATLWRQVAQTLIALGDLDRRKPQERRRPVRCGDLRELPNHAHDDS
jgi:hypothetical protein